MRSVKAERSRDAAERIVIPALLPLIGVSGTLRAGEGAKDGFAEMLDLIGGVDFYVLTRRSTIVTIASRVQWIDEDE